MAACAVVGCESHPISTPNYTFHRLPRCSTSRALWLLAIGRPLRTTNSCTQVCSRHFAESMFVRRGCTKTLIQNAMPTLFLPPPSKKRQRVKATESDDLLACRVCLATDAPLYTIAGSGLQDKFTELTGTPLSVADGLPRRLCAWCRAQLSKYAAFRARCQRSHSLLKTLLARGPLKITDILTVDRRLHKLTHNLTVENIFSFQNPPVIEIAPVIKFKNENTPSEASQASDFDDAVKDVDMDVSELNIEIGQKFKRVELEHDYNHEHLIKAEAVMDIEVQSDANDVGTATSDEAVQKGIKKKRAKDDEITSDDSDVNTKDDTDYADSPEDDEIIKIKNRLQDKINSAAGYYRTKLNNTEFHSRNKRRKIGDDFYPNFDYEDFQKTFIVTIRRLTPEEQKQEIEDRKKANKAKLCCEMCGRGYNFENTMKKHMLVHHSSSKPHECEICLCRFRLKCGLLDHRDRHRLTFTCNSCSFITRDREGAKAHFFMHQGRTYNCPYCDQVYNRKSSYLSHLRIHHPKMNVACDECGETFVSERGVFMHKKRAHIPIVKTTTEFKCSECDVEFLSAAALNKHTDLTRAVSHAALSPCAACGESCDSEVALAAHKAEHHPPDQHHCVECNSTFASAASFNTHVKRKHLGQKLVTRTLCRTDGSGSQGPVVCEVCGRIVKNPAKLQYHLNTHMATKPYACSECPKTFAMKSVREIHMRVHTGEKPYKCKLCSMAFSMQGNYARHYKYVHLGQHENVPCELCHKRFTTVASKKLHVRSVHSNMPWPKRMRKSKKAANAAEN